MCATHFLRRNRECFCPFVCSAIRPCAWLSVCSCACHGEWVFHVKEHGRYRAEERSRATSSTLPTKQETFDSTEVSLRALLPIPFEKPFFLHFFPRSITRCNTELPVFTFRVYNRRFIDSFFFFSFFFLTGCSYFSVSWERNSLTVRFTLDAVGIEYQRDRRDRPFLGIGDR